MSVSINGIAFINPLYNAFAYGRRAALSFFKYTPEELNPICITVDDCSPLYHEQDWNYWHTDMPADRCVFHHFNQSDGLTRSWNWGLSKARKLGCRYAIAGNSDILFTPGWYEGLLWHLDRDVALVGPVTNCPGWANGNSQRQNVKNYYPGYQLLDDSVYLADVARHLKETRPIEEIRLLDIGGFFTMATVDRWWAGAFQDAPGKRHVFDPKHKLTNNEVELQKRWTRRGWTVGCVPSSFIYHYRAVSRGDRHNHQGWARLDDVHKSV